MENQTPSSEQSFNKSSAYKILKAMANDSPQSYVPFLFKSKRAFPGPINHSKESPPVGSYDLPSAFVQKHRFASLQAKNIEIEDLVMKKQSHFFRSKFRRFDSNQIQNTPSPTTYQMNKTFSHKTISKAKRVSKAFSSVNQNHTNCPSIPDRNIKFGYTQNCQGQVKIINKTLGQLEKERIKTKQYKKTLTGERDYETDPNSTSFTKEYLKNVCKMNQNSQRVKNIFNQSRRNFQSQRESLSAKKPIKIDFRQIKKNMSRQSNRIISSLQKQGDLGPGHYNIDLNTINSSRKSDRFQFFGSTEVRFKEPNIVAGQNQYTEEECNDQRPTHRSLQNSVHLTACNGSKESKKRLFPIPKSKRVTPQPQDTPQIPGPGDYDPNLQLIRKKTQKAILLTKQKRFHQLYRSQKDLIRLQRKMQQEDLIKLYQNQVINNSSPLNLMSLNQRMPDQSRPKPTFDDKSLKKKRFQAVYKSQTPDKPQKIKGVIVKVGQQAKKSTGKTTKKIPRSTPKHEHYHSNIKLTNDFEITCWEKEATACEQKLYGGNGKKIQKMDTQISSLTVSPHGQGIIKSNSIMSQHNDKFFPMKVVR